jgi:glycyl-tRNA synthetase beta chain
MSDLLIEIGCEELPAGSAVGMAEHLASMLQTALADAGLTASAAQYFGTPRRIAAYIPNVSPQQAGQAIERIGPAVASAYTDGEPTPALLGFLKNAGATLNDVSTVETPKGDRIVVKQMQAGRSLEALVNAVLPGIIKTLPVPKRMRWSDKPYEFLRPVVWLTALHGSEVLPVSVLGMQSGNTTLGHRFHAPGAITLPSADAYLTTLEKAYVMADVEARRASIVQQVQAVADDMGGTPVMDEALVDEVTSLVEWPVALGGRFEELYLEIPKEALIQTMQENQRYFALLDDSGTLLPAFITVANLESKNPATVIDGNERVIRPRFADTKFFWDQDKRQTLADHQAALNDVLFQEKLGSVADKTQRMATLIPLLAPVLGADDQDSATAIALCKCDLTTEIVKELAKMQGICGRYYAQRDGHNASIAAAMEEHYFPKQAGGALPGNPVAELVAIADKTDTLVGIYGQGLVPTGTKDPFALRRATLGVVRTLIEHQRDLDMAELIDASIASYKGSLGDVDRDGLLGYVADRIRGYAQDQGVSHDVVDAVLAKSASHPLDVMARMQAISAFRSEPAAASLSAAVKRIGNILKKQGIADTLTVSEAAFEADDEKALYEALQSVSPGVIKQLAARDYANAMVSMSSLKEPVDAFFDNVMVMVDDLAVRNNRLALLQQVHALCSDVADLSQLQIKG